jgi:hypothetical protein
LPTSATKRQIVFLKATPTGRLPVFHRSRSKVTYFSLDFHRWNNLISAMKILLEISPEHYDRLLRGISEKSVLYGVLKNGVIVQPAKSRTGSKMVEILCDKFHARMIGALAKNLSPQAVPQIEKAIRLSRMYH